MAVNRIHEQPKLILSSADQKPSDAIIGTEIWEHDTKLIWICYDKVAGVSQWMVK
jgi:hypothetical protein